MRKIYLLFLLLLTVTTVHLFGQQASIPKNLVTFTPWTTNNFSGLSLGPTDWTPSLGSNVNTNVLNNSTSTATGYVFFVAFGGDTQDSIRVVDASNVYPAGNVVGFRGSILPASVGVSLEISTWNGTTRVDRRVFNSGLLGGLLGTTSDFTLVTTGNYNAVQVKVFTEGNNIAYLGGFSAQHAIVKAFEAGPETDCNLPTIINANSVTNPNPASQSFDVNEERTGAIGAAVMSNPYNLIDNNDATTVDITTVVAGGANLSLIDRAKTYTDPYYVGFDIRRASLISVDALGSMQVKTFLNGVERETINLNDQAVGASVLNTNTMRVGFVTSLPFNEVQFIQSGVIVPAGSFSLVNFVMTRFCDAADLDCNETVNLTNPDHSVYINSVRSGVDGLGCANCSVNGATNILDTDPTNYASLNMVVGGGANVAVSVKDAMRSYPANTYAGFDITTPSLLNLTLLSGLRVETYLNNVAQETFTGANLLGLGSSFVGGVTTSRIGFLAGQPFDEIRLVVLGALSANIGETRVYNAFITRMCDVNELSCNVPTTLSFPEFPVLINSVNTGITSAGCAGCSLNNTSAILDGDPATYATLNVAGGLLTTARISVKKAVTPFFANTFIGIPIQSTSLVGFDLLNSVKLLAYNNGTLVSETNASTNALINPGSSILFPTGTQLLGFVPEGEFDELILEFTIPASVTAGGNIDIFDVQIQQFCHRTISCDETIYLNQGDPGNPSAPGMPAYVNYARTGSEGIACVGCTVSNAQNVVSPNTTDYASINLVAGGVSGAGISVVDGLNVYPEGTYAGFTVENVSALAVLDFLSSITIQTYLNGTLQESSTNLNLVSLELIGIPIFGTGTGMYNVGFQATLPFNEVRIISREIAGIGLLNELRVYGAWVDTRQSNGGTLFCHKQANPDMNVALQNMTISSSVASNDIMPAGAVYSSWSAHPDNPAGATLTTQPNGEYTFTAPTVGEYIYYYEVCVGTAGLCFPSFIKITVTPDNNSHTGTYPVIVNPDNANVLSGNSTTLNVVANDHPGNDMVDLNLASLRLSVIPSELPQNGIALPNADGTITYTPLPGFIGRDSLKYYISDNHTTPNEGSTWVVFHVYPADYVNTVVANNDFNASRYRGPVSGNVLHNDHDPEGDVITVVEPAGGRMANTKNKKGYSVSARIVTTPEGVLDIAEDGTYTFTPNPGFTGTYQHVYQIQDDNPTGTAVSLATLSILVSQAYTLPIVVSEFDVKRENATNVLRWKTSLEQNASHFGIERSTDGVNFTEIARVTADNRSQYRYEDAFQHNGKVYYRLKLVDIDLTSEYSAVKFVETENRFSLSVYPNPAVNGRTYLNTGSYSGTVSVRISDAAGRTVAQKQLQVQQNATVELPLLPAQKGIYYIMVLDSNGNRILQAKILNQ